MVNKQEHAMVEHSDSRSDGHKVEVMTESNLSTIEHIVKVNEEEEFRLENAALVIIITFCPSLSQLVCTFLTPSFTHRRRFQAPTNQRHGERAILSYTWLAH